MLEDFFEGLYNLRSKLMDCDIEVELGLTRDTSGYVYVDGEEGDYGRITYSDGQGNLIATKVIEGGDCEHWEYTDLGKQLLKSRLVALIDEAVAEL